MKKACKEVKTMRKELMDKVMLLAKNRNRVSHDFRWSNMEIICVASALEWTFTGKEVNVKA